MTTLTLQNGKQAYSKGLVDFVKRFCDLSLDCYEQQAESKLVEMCINNMLPEFKVHLENLDICQFAKLMDSARKTALSVRLPQRGILYQVMTEECMAVEGAED